MNKMKLSSISIIVILLLLTAFNYYQRNRDVNELQSRNTIESKRLNAFGNALFYFGKPIGDVQMIDAITMNRQDLSFKRPTLIVLLSNYGCSKCQNRELENINNYLINVPNNKINIIAVGNNNSREVLLKLRKVTQSKIPMYLDENSDFINTYKITDVFPQYIYVLNNRIMYSFLPIQDDDEYSKWFIENIKRNNRFINDI